MINISLKRKVGTRNYDNRILLRYILVCGVANEKCMQGPLLYSFRKNIRDMSSKEMLKEVFAFEKDLLTDWKISPYTTLH